MSVETEKNTYGLGEGVLRVCQLLGLKFPAKIPTDGEHFPSDYFGDDLKLNSGIMDNLCFERKWSREQLTKVYEIFFEKFTTQKSLKQNNTNLSIYFCDYVLFAIKQLGASPSDYFDFEFYNKSFALRSSFLVERHFHLRMLLCNDYNEMPLVNDKAKANVFFSNFLHRDWLDPSKCNVKELKLFAAKHPRFISKPVMGFNGEGIKIIETEPEQKFKKMLTNLRNKKMLVEEIISQHEEISAFCPDTLNTIKVYTILDTHNVAHILTANGCFGRVGNVADNPQQGGYYVTIDPKTGIIISDAINNYHERVSAHPDTGKTFKGFQYPSWEKVRATVKAMAKLIPQLRHIAWDIAINDAGEVVLVEPNVFSAVDIQQAADSVGKLPLYLPLLLEIQNYKEAKMRRLGYRVNNLPNVNSYDPSSLHQDSRLQYAITNLIPDCASLMDLGCRKSKTVESLCPKNVKYFPVDFKKHDKNVIACDFDKDEFPDFKVDTCLCAFTAEYVKHLPKFLNNMCHAAQKQILIWACPVDKEINNIFRWQNPFLTDFTEEFLITTMKQNNFQLTAQYNDTGDSSIILYDFRRA
jgi:hypothetical protein